MNKIYCPNCYSSNTYTSSTPNFCQKCGKPFNSTVESIASTKANNTPIKPVTQESDVEIETVPNIDKIEFTIDTNLRHNRQTLQSLAGTKKEEPVPLSSINNKKAKKLSKKELEKFWSESFPKTNRENPSSIGENQ